MQKKSVMLFMTAVWLIAVLPAAANNYENFNSRKGVPIHQVRMNLQNFCWTFHHFDVNHNGWNPAIEGDGAMVSDADAIRFNNSGIYTPLLSVGSDIVLSFDYRFNENFLNTASRWMKVCLTNTANEVVQVLEEFQFNGSNATTVKNYNTQFKNVLPGEYRLLLLYGGKGGTAMIAVDDLNISSPLKYPRGCNLPPLAVKDKITGTPNRTAFGSLLHNDSDKDRDALKAFLVKGSADGSVELNRDGTFVFIPRADFKGNSTSFVYRICDEGASNLCSPSTTVHINFPGRITGNELTGFKGAYRYDGNVELAWQTRTGSPLEKFEIERSLDGKSWKKTGIVQAKEELFSRSEYKFTDKVSKNKAHNKDLYYRLKQVRADGTISMSRLLIVRVYNTRTVTMISITPDPAKTDIAVNIQLMETSYVSMRILDLSGTTILRKVVEAKKGINNILVNGSSDLEPGSYMLEVIVNSKERMLVRLIKE